MSVRSKVVSPAAPTGDRDGGAATEKSSSVLHSEILNDPLIRMALMRLFRACVLAGDCGRSQAAFSLTADELNAGGVTTAELRWLIEKDLVRHIDSSGGETETEADEATSAVESPISPQSRFCLTHLGSGIAAQYVDIDPTSQSGSTLPSGAISELSLAHGGSPANLRPIWDNQRHELRIGSVLVKRYKWRASNQERILAAFEEEGWPVRIDDPLPPHPEIDAKRRLSDTIKCLNRNQIAARIRFIGDGTGEGVRWEKV